MRPMSNRSLPDLSDDATNAKGQHVEQRKKTAVKAAVFLGKAGSGSGAAS